MRRFRFLVYFVLFFTAPYLTFADISVTEIMYDHSGSDTDLEWVEFYNSGSDTINLSGWKFNDGANHTLNAPPANGGMGSLEIGPSDYIVLAANASLFLGEYPSYSGNLIDTVMSLTNTSDTVALVDENSVTIASYTYDSTEGGTGDGSSLSKINGVWTSGEPSPGEPNSSVSDSDVSLGDTDSDFSGYSISTEEDAEISDFVPPEDNVEILSDVVIISGIPSDFDSFLEKANGDTSRAGYYAWNMGDGTQFTFKPAKKFQHTYYYPGEYVVTLDYYKVDSIEKDDTDRLVVKVVDASVVVKILEGGAVEVSNNSKFEHDLNGWVIESDTVSYRFPENSIILAGKKFILSSKNTHFPPTVSKVTLRYPTGEIAYEYPQYQAEKQNTPKVSYFSSKKAYSDSSNTQAMSGIVDSKNISANTANLSIPKNTYIYLGLVGLIVLGIGSIFYTNRVLKEKNKDTKSEADEFELIEE